MEFCIHCQAFELHVPATDTLQISHTIVSILHDYVLRSVQYHLYEICQSQLKTQSLTVTSCEN